LSDYVLKTQIFRDGDETKNIQMGQVAREEFDTTNSNIFIGATPTYSMLSTSTIGIGFNTKTGGPNNIIIGHNSSSQGFYDGDSIIVGHNINPDTVMNRIVIGSSTVQNINIGGLSIDFNLQTKVLTFAVGRLQAKLNLIDPLENVE
jgi:hypothetical protein